MARFYLLVRGFMLFPGCGKALQENPEPIIKGLGNKSRRCKLPRCKHWTCHKGWRRTDAWAVKFYRKNSLTPLCLDTAN